MRRRRGRAFLGLLSGLIWGLGAAVLIQQYGLWPPDFYLLVGLPVGAALLSTLWSRRGRAALLLMLSPGLVLAQEAPCHVTIDGPGIEARALEQTTARDPAVIPEDVERINVTIDFPGTAIGEVWVDVAGFRVPARTGSFEGGRGYSISADNIEPYLAPGLYHIGGSIQGRCQASGYVRIQGNPLDDPLGGAALGAILIGLLGTWIAGRPSRRGRTDDGPPETAPGSRLPLVVRPPRLRARLYDATTNRSLGYFTAGRSHVIEVDLVTPDPAWHDLRLPAQPQEPVMVVLTEPTLAPVPQVGVVEGGEAGGTTAFRLDVPPGADHVDARLIALVRNRILHTVRLPSTVVPALDAAAETLPATDVAEPETTVAANIGRSDPRRVDVALLVNHGGGTSRVVGAADDEAAVVEVGTGDVAEAVDKLRTRLGEVVQAPDDFGTLEDAGAVELLVFLAHHGRLMRNALVGDFLRGRLADASTLQVASATPDAFFPFEFAYDFPAPGEDAGLCPEALATLRAQDPATPCPAAHSSRTVCPVGFWGMNRVIERHAHQPGEELPVGFLVRSIPRRGRNHLSEGPILFAASDRVDAVIPGSIRNLSAHLTEATDGHTTEARSWKEWIADVADGPALTILLPHTVYSDSLETYGLEIGASDRSWAGEIDRRFVPPDDRPVIAVLLGCETAAAGRVSYERFPGLFRRAGAEVVFATLTEVLGRHAAPVAEALADGVLTGWTASPLRFGELALVLRRRLLAQGLLSVLAVVAFGDADWVLAGRAIRSPGSRQEIEVRR